MLFLQSSMIMIKSYDWFETIMKYSLDIYIFENEKEFNKLPVSDVFKANWWRLNAVNLFYEQFDKMD
jgi:hypothetical protein